jgi:DNA-binding XRE family transcriptional regulator
LPNICDVSLDGEANTLADVAPADPVAGLGPRLARQPPKPPRAVLVPHLAEWRTRAGLTQAQLALRSGVARETIARLEHGRLGAT